MNIIYKDIIGEALEIGLNEIVKENRITKKEAEFYMDYLVQEERYTIDYSEVV